VITLRHGFTVEELDAIRPDLVVLSPGPGEPKDFDVSGTIGLALRRDLPVFGVCLGLQGMVEHFGGQLDVLPYPMHGKPSTVKVLGGRVFEGLPTEFTAGRYHSLYAVRERMPAALKVTAETEDGVIMGIEHRDLPLAAVQFHPESILTLEGDLGMQLIRRVVAALTAPVAVGSR
jgi:anthranilate synthase